MDREQGGPAIATLQGVRDMTRLRAVFSIIVCAALSAACAPKVREPQPPTPREATLVNAPLDRVWIAAVDAFADRNIPISTIDRSSGIIVAAASVRVDTSDAVKLADCGAVFNGMDWAPIPPASASYNIRVRPDNAGATVRATVMWKTQLGNECSTLHVWERLVEAAIKEKAER